MLQHYDIERIESDKKPSKDVAEGINYWGKTLGRLSMAPHVEGKGWAGNLGCRDDGIIWVTCNGCDLSEITIDDIVGIVERENKIVYFGHPDKRPTSEWEIYSGLFKERIDINAILHGHDEITVRNAERLNEKYDDVSLTKGITLSGSPDFRDEILEIAGNKNYLIGREHGFFALGKDLYSAGLLALDYRKKAKELK